MSDFINGEECAQIATAGRKPTVRSRPFGDPNSSGQRKIRLDSWVASPRAQAFASLEGVSSPASRRGALDWSRGLG